MSKCQCDTVNGILVSIAEATDCNLPSLKISGVNTNPEALGKAVCKIPNVEITEVIFRTAEDLEQFLSQIISCSCDSLVLQSLTFNYGLFRSTKKDKVLSGIDPRLLGLVAVKLQHFKVHVDVRLAEAVLLSIGECSDSKLQYLELDVWNKWASYYGDETIVRDKYQSIQKRKQFENIFKEEIEIAESKLKSLTIRFNGRTRYVKEGRLSDDFSEDFKEMLIVLKNKNFKEIPRKHREDLMVKIERILSFSDGFPYPMMFLINEVRLEDLKDIREAFKNIDCSNFSRKKDLTTNLRYCLDGFYQTDEMQKWQS